MAPRKAAASDGPQNMDQLQQRYVKLNEQKIAAETELRGAEKQLKQLQDEAREKYGTDDVAKLQTMLSDLKAENEAKRAGYQAELDRIENDLAAVEERFNVSQSPCTPDSGK
jgi:hypothetical protein